MLHFYNTLKNHDIYKIVVEYFTKVINITNYPYKCNKIKPVHTLKVIMLYQLKHLIYNGLYVNSLIYIHFTNELKSSPFLKNCIICTCFQE